MISTIRTLVPVRDGSTIGDMPVTLSVLCVTCAHLGNGLTCKAFPDGIPDVIRTGEADHRESFPGDHGILYKLATGVTPPNLGGRS